MKFYSLIFILIILFSCNSEEEVTSEDISKNTTILVAPYLIDVNYDNSENEHYIVRNTTNHKNKLLLFIGGSFSIPKNYTFISEHAAKIGLDVINLSYPNEIPTVSLASSSDFYEFDNYREEICFGNPVSNIVNINSFNCIETRLTKLIIYLKNNYPSQNWSQYLTNSNTLQWDKIIVSGHSQGSGHACYLGKKKPVDRVVMFSGPNDYSTYYNQPANWLIDSGITPSSQHYSLLHTQDEVVSFTNQVSNLRGLGLLNLNEDPLIVDFLTTPFSNKHSLSLNISALSNHNSTIGGNSILPSIWTYILLN